jgi:hypothetical protein
MPLPTPEPGLVIRYQFLWSHEFDGGDEEGETIRPCLILSAKQLGNGATTVRVVPITHRPPTNPASEIPPAVRKHLGLDEAPSWIILTELNEFIWPGRYVFQIPGTLDRFDHGVVPPMLLKRVVASILSIDNRVKRLMARRD